MSSTHFYIIISMALCSTLASAQKPPPNPQVSVGELMDSAKELYLGMYFEEALSFTTAVISHKDATTQDILDATMLEGSVLVVMGNTLAAEKSFMKLLSLRIDYQLPKNTSLKIVQVFRKAHFDFQNVQKRKKDKALAEKNRDIAIFDESPPQGQGGRDYVFKLKLKDEKQWIKTIQVNYRKANNQAYSSLILTNTSPQDWGGILPAALTENPSGFNLEYYMTSSDAQDQALTKLYDTKSPRSITFTPGSVAGHRSILERPWFWGVSAAVVVTGISTFILLNQQNKCTGTCLDFPE
jgi:hypothetical protein